MEPRETGFERNNVMEILCLCQSKIDLSVTPAKKSFISFHLRRHKKFLFFGHFNIRWLITVSSTFQDLKFDGSL